MAYINDTPTSLSKRLLKLQQSVSMVANTMLFLIIANTCFLWNHNIVFIEYLEINLHMDIYNKTAKA